MPLARIYRKGPEALANYPYTDVVSGLGFQEFWGIIDADETGAKTYNLITTQEYSAQIEISRGTNAGTSTFNYESSTFNLQRIAKGTAYFSFGWENSANGGRIKVQLQKLHSNGSTTTNISSELTNELPTSAGDNTAFMVIPLSETLIGSGEKLRLVVKIILDNSAVHAITVGTDPKNRDGTVITPSSAADMTTVMKFIMPFKVDI